MIRESLREEFEDTLTQLREEADRVRDRAEAETKRVHAVLEMRTAELSEKSEALDRERREIAAERLTIRRDTQEMNESSARQTKAVADRMAQFGDRATQIIGETLRDEIGELAADMRQERRRMRIMESKVETFISDEISSQVAALEEERQGLESSRRLVERDRRKVLESARREFLADAGHRVSEFVERVLREEIEEMRVDIAAARENEFGRRIFEAVAAEFRTSIFNEESQMSDYENEIVALQEEVRKRDGAIARRDREIAEGERRLVVSELTAPLSSKQRKLMEKLLEGVPTEELEGKFSECIKDVLESGASPEAAPRPGKAGPRARRDNEIRLTEDRKSAPEDWRVMNGDRAGGNAPAAGGNGGASADDPELARLGLLANPEGDM